jgi:hypothetical protein
LYGKRSLGEEVTKRLRDKSFRELLRVTPFKLSVTPWLKK